MHLMEKKPYITCLRYGEELLLKSYWLKVKLGWMLVMQQL